MQGRVSMGVRGWCISYSEIFHLSTLRQPLHGRWHAIQRALETPTGGGWHQPCSGHVPQGGNWTTQRYNAVTRRGEGVIEGAILACRKALSSEVNYWSVKLSVSQCYLLFLRADGGRRQAQSSEFSLLNSSPTTVLRGAKTPRVAHLPAHLLSAQH